MAKKRESRRVSARGPDGRFASPKARDFDLARNLKARRVKFDLPRRVSERLAQRVDPPKAKFGVKSGLAGGVFGALLLSGLFGGGKKTPEGLPPELQMQLAAALQAQQAGAASGKDTTKTLQDIARLLAVLKGARELAGVVTPPPFSPAQSNNPFGASGLVA